MKKYLDVALTAVRKAEKEILNVYNKVDFEVDYKEDNTPVTIADKHAEEIIISEISKYFPTHSFLGEEFGSQHGDSEFKWIIDPIDGTVKFSRHIPLFSTQLALVQGNEVILGITNNPELQEIFYAEKGKGSFKNNKQIHVSAIKDLSKAFVSTGGIIYFHRTGTLTNLIKLVDKCRSRGFGDAYAYSLLAGGNIDISLEGGTKIWDIAASKIIIEEAGGKVTDFKGNETVPTIIKVGVVLPPDIKSKFESFGFFGLTSLNNDTVMPPDFILEHLLFNNELRLAADKFIPPEPGQSRLDKIADKIDANFWRMFALFTIPLTVNEKLRKQMDQFSNELKNMTVKMKKFIEGWKLEVIKAEGRDRLHIRRSDDNKSEIVFVEDKEDQSKSYISMKTTFGNEEVKVSIPANNQGKVVIEFVSEERRGEKVEFDPNNDEEVEKVAESLKVKKEKLATHRMVGDVILTGKLFSNDEEQEEEIDSRTALEKMTLG